jgi:hypothetical protein
MSDENRKVELAKVLQAVRAFAPEPDYLQIRSLLVKEGSEQKIDQAIHGLSKEDEFALMSRLMGTATHMVHLEQRPVIPGEYIVPDFLARFQPGSTLHRKPASQSSGFRCFVEVKSTRKDRFRTGGKKLQRLRAFANQFGLPLLFAVRFLHTEEYAPWVIVEDSDRNASSVIVPYDISGTGVRCILWDDYYYFLHDFHFRVVYDSSPPCHGVGCHQRYGAQRDFQIVAADGEVVPCADVDHVTLLAFVGAFSLREIAVRQEGTLTFVTLRAEAQACSVADMLYHTNRFARDERGRVVFAPSRILTGSDSDEQLFTRAVLDSIAAALSRMKVLQVPVGFDLLTSHIGKWREYGGRDELL